MSGSAVVYHTGFLALDRRGDEDLDQRAFMLSEPARHGKVPPTRRRLVSGSYDDRHGCIAVARIPGATIGRSR
jgi:hypothetical protein